MKPVNGFFKAATALGAVGCIALSGSVTAGAGPAAKPTCFGKAATIIGKPGNDFLLTGTRRADVIAGLGGNDRIDGGGGNDLICGGAGSDILAGGPGADRLDGGAGFDTCRAGEKLAACEETRPALPARGQIGAGSYVTDQFVPHFSLQLGAGWYSTGEAQPSVVLFHGARIGRDPALAFNSAASAKPVADVVGGIAAEPLLHATAASPVTVAGGSGMRFQITVDSNAGRLVQVPGLSRDVVLPPEYRGRVDVVSVGGRTVVIIAIALPAEFDGYLPVADGVLATVQFRP